MTRLIPATRAILVTAAFVLAGAAAATAAETVTTETTTETVEAEKPFKPTIYVGPGFGAAFQDYNDDENTEFGWAMQVLMRVHENAALQIEYFNLGSIPNQSGEFDGAYFGVSPILPVGGGASLFGQIGAAFSDAGEDVAGGGGVMYDLPYSMLEDHLDITLRLDYKYFNLDEGQHLLLFGFMLGFHK